MKACIIFVVLFVLLAAYVAKIDLRERTTVFEDGSTIVEITYCPMFGICQDR